MKKSFSISVLTAFGTLSAVHAQTPAPSIPDPVFAPNANRVASCVVRDSERDLTSIDIVKVAKDRVKVIENRVFINFEDRKIERKSEVELSAIGTISLAAQGGDFAGRDPLVVLADQKNLGKNSGLFSQKAEPGSPTSRMWSFSIDRSGTSAICQDGPAIATFIAAGVKGGTLSKELVEDLRDDQMAFRCTSIANPSRGSFKVRALSFTFAHSSLQVRAPEDTSFTGLDLDEFVESAKDITYKRARDTIVFPPQPNSAKFILQKQKVKSASGKLVYLAEFFDGKGGSDKLSCIERWSVQKNILKPVTEARSIAKALPDPGKISDAKKELCGDFEKVKAVQGRYSDLLMKLEGITGFGIGSLKAKAKGNPFDIDCLSISIGAETAEKLTAIETQVGQTLEGVLIEYEKMGPIIAH